MYIPPKKETKDLQIPRPPKGAPFGTFRSSAAWPSASAAWSRMSGPSDPLLGVHQSLDLLETGNENDEVPAGVGVPCQYLLIFLRVVC